MATLFFNMILVVAFFSGLAGWAFRKLNPQVKDAAARGAVSLIARLFRM
jgi:hypothetical protein